MCEKCRLEDPPRSSRRAVLGFAAASAITLALGRPAAAKNAKPPPKPDNVLSPDAALARLRQGNRRYIEGVTKRHDFKHERERCSAARIPMPAS